MTSAATLEVRSPYTGEMVGQVPLSDASQIRAMLRRGAAYRNTLTRHQRAEILEHVATELRERAEELATLVTRESGLCLKDTRHELVRAADVFRFAAGEALRDGGESFAGDVSANGRARRAHTMRVPVRLIGAITPFNHPINQVAHKLAPAIAAGAPIVLKPSEKTPLGAIALFEMLSHTDLPAPAAQLVIGEPATVLDEFLAEQDLDLISFTGSVTVGKMIASRLGYRRAVLELGGNDPLIVLADADLEEATALALAGAFGNSGQRCTAVKRIIVDQQVADEFAERLAAGAASIRVGDPLDADTGIGTVIDERAAVEIARRVDAAIADGATLLYGGQRNGAQLTPAVLDGVTPGMELVRSETFGPVAPIIRVSGLDEAINTANATPYALSCGVCTFDWRAISRCIQEVRAGTVNVREVPGWRTEITPFGGVGDSGLGVKEGVREAVNTMTFSKLYTLPWD
ncbi:MAG: aldehyde dehydrogenase family protein [Solirubrobacteraceae bacterium]